MWARVRDDGIELVPEPESTDGLVPVIEDRPPLAEGEMYGDPTYEVGPEGVVIHYPAPPSAPTAPTAPPQAPPPDLLALRARVAAASTVAGLRAAVLGVVDAIAAADTPT